MHVNLAVITSEDYFIELDKEIDWEEDDNSKVSSEQADKISEILATEVSIYLLRRCTGSDGSVIDKMASIRRKLINQYEKDYEPYIEYNDYY